MNSNVILINFKVRWSLTWKSISKAMTPPTHCYSVLFFFFFFLAVGCIREVPGQANTWARLPEEGGTRENADALSGKPEAPESWLKNSQHKPGVTPLIWPAWGLDTNSLIGLVLDDFNQPMHWKHTNLEQIFQIRSDWHHTKHAFWERNTMQLFKKRKMSGMSALCSERVFVLRPFVTQIRPDKFYFPSLGFSFKASESRIAASTNPPVCLQKRSFKYKQADIRIPDDTGGKKKPTLFPVFVCKIFFFGRGGVTLRAWTQVCEHTRI